MLKNGKCSPLKCSKTRNVLKRLNPDSCLGVTVCNLNAVHRGRFCSSEDLEKPKNVEKILCATLTDLFEVCKITESLADLVEEGNYICTGSRSGKETKGRGSSSRGRTGERKKSETTTGSGGKGEAGSRRAGVRGRKRNPAPREETVTKYPNSTEGPRDIVALRNSTEGPRDIVIPKVSIPRFVKRIAARKITKFAKDNNLTDILPKDSTINAILNGQWNGQGIAPGSTIEANSGTGTTGTRTTGRRRGRREAFDGEGISTNSGGCLFRDKREGILTNSGSYLFRDKREAGEIKFNLRSLLSTFRSLQSGNLSGGLLQPLTVSVI